MNQDEVVSALTLAAEPLGWSPSRGALETGHYIVLAELANHLVDKKRAGQTDGFDDLFNVVETLLGGASPDARDLIIVGFLEDIQNVWLNAGGDLASWTRWLGSSTASAWAALIKMWSGEMPPDQFNSVVRGGLT